MQTDKAKQLREDWGDKPCDHPSIVKEYYLGTHTMDYVCTVCGAELTKNTKDNIESRRTKDKEDQA